MKKLFFVDDKNCLLLKSKSALQFLMGDWVTVENNTLVYTSYSMPSSKGKEIKFQGKWKLDSNHNLILDVKENEEYFASQLVLKGEILGPQKDSFVFQLKASGVGDRQKINLLKLQGKWGADKFNRINFTVEKGDNPDSLVFLGQWDIANSQKIIYRYERVDLRTKQKVTNHITFDGFWEINTRNRLRYILCGSSDSFFEFRGQIESPSLYPKDGEIKYRLGAGRKDDRRDKTISLYGSWNFSRKWGLGFEMEYAKGQVKAIQFQAKVNLNQNNTLTFTLVDNDKKPLGFKVIFEHNLFPRKELSYFLEISKTRGDFYIGVGGKLYF